MKSRCTSSKPQILVVQIFSGFNFIIAAVISIKNDGKEQELKMLENIL